MKAAKGSCSPGVAPKTDQLSKRSMTTVYQHPSAGQWHEEGPMGCQNPSLVIFSKDLEKLLPLLTWHTAHCNEAPNFADYIIDQSLVVLFSIIFNGLCSPIRWKTIARIRKWWTRIKAQQKKGNITESFESSFNINVYNMREASKWGVSISTHSDIIWHLMNAITIFIKTCLSGPLNGMYESYPLSSAMVNLLLVLVIDF